MIATETKQLKITTLKTKQLKDAVTKSIGGKGPYEDMLLKVTSGSNVLEVITADDDSYLSLFVEITDSECDLSVPINKKSLTNILKNIKDDTITLLLQEDDNAEYLIIKTEKANYRIKTTLNRIFEAYEELPKEPKGKILLNGSAVAKAIDSVIYATSKDKIDPESYKSIGFIFE
ncbi:MAG: hypothetical protein JHC31_13330, partial [Sulfurihydrogenibium sp.]|nr:hypothetical protein [Sulfurihydrogenibium sp.]